MDRRVARTQKFYRMTPDDRGVMFGLSTAHTAVALAVVTIGYNFGLMNIAMLNGTVLMILLTCALAPMITSRSAAGIKPHMLERNDSTAVARQPHSREHSGACILSCHRTRTLWNWPSRSTPEDRPTTSTPSTSATTTPP